MTPISTAPSLYWRDPTACDVCDLPIDADVWDDRHELDDGECVYHPWCCPRPDCVSARAGETSMPECAGCDEPIVGCAIDYDFRAYCSNDCVDVAIAQEDAA